LNANLRDAHASTLICIQDVIFKPLNTLLDAEAVRVVSAMSKWTPAKIKNETVNVNFVLPIIFKL